MEIFTKNSAKCTIFQSTNCNKFSSLMKSKAHLSPSGAMSAWALRDNGAFGPSYDVTRSMLTPTFHISMNRYFLQDYNGVSLILSLSFERELFPEI
jgi:hypothetical protein